jgi:PAS domain S-box-containing protein
MSEQFTADSRATLESRLKLAEEILDISNRNIHLTMEILVRGSNDAEHLINQQTENTAAILLRVQKIREQVQSSKERELLNAAGIRWSSPRYQQGLRNFVSGQKSVDPGTAMADVMLPLLLDNNSWMAFVEFLRTELETPAADPEASEATAVRARELVRANQILKSKIAERKRMEERLSQLGSIIESSSDAIIIHSLDGTMVSWNTGAETIYGYSASEALGKPSDLLIAHDAQTDELPEVLTVAERGETVQVYEAVHVRKDGRRIDVSTAVSPVKDAEGTIVGMAAITRDISERKKAEERFYKAFDANPAPITIATLSEGRYIDVNESFLRITGCRREDVIGRTSLEMKFWESAEDRAGLVKALRETGSVRDVEITFVTKSGEQRTGSNSAEIIEIGGEKCVIAIFRDLTEQKVLEDKLRKAHRMEAIGQLSGGIAHDFNNLLTVMIGHSELLEERLARSDSSYRSAEEIKKAGTHAASLTRQLLAYTRQQVLAPEVLDLNAVIADLEKMLRRLIGEDIDFNTQLAADLSCIKADPGQIQQVIMNLVVNARDAMPDGGKLFVRTAHADMDEEVARRCLAESPYDYVLLQISDTGIGMDAETQAHIFEPFFTTKEVGKGTGLGLSTVYGVVKQSGGYVWVDSQPGRGTTFSIYLPKTAEVPAPRKSGSTLPESLRGVETILLVEDAGPVRELTRDWLINSGYTVLEAQCAHDAVRIAHREKRPIDLLLTDVVMPKMNGPALAKRVNIERPDTKVLFMSGYTGFRDQACLDSSAIILPKPFGRDVLLRKVREALRAEIASTTA